MDSLDLILLFAAVAMALLSRTMMKRLALRRLGRANGYLLEVDFWRATSGESLARGLLLVELASWAAIILLVAELAALVLA
jgi:hypothetical protein